MNLAAAFVEREKEGGGGGRQIDNLATLLEMIK